MKISPWHRGTAKHVLPLRIYALGSCSFHQVFTNFSFRTSEGITTIFISENHDQLFPLGRLVQKISTKIKEVYYFTGAQKGSKLITDSNIK